MYTVKKLALNQSNIETYNGLEYPGGLMYEDLDIFYVRKESTREQLTNNVGKKNKFMHYKIYFFDSEIGTLTYKIKTSINNKFSDNLDYYAVPGVKYTIKAVIDTRTSNIERVIRFKQITRNPQSCL